MADSAESPSNALPERTAHTDAATSPASGVWRPKFNPWLIAVVVAMAAFMEVLDTSIANVALPYMAGNLGASNDQSTWVLTSYLVSNAIVLPISGWFANVLGRKRFFMMCLAIFTVSSLLCGIAPSLGAIILFRILQGAGGGGLQPMAQAILADTFPPEKRGLAFALYGVTVIVAPTIGPTLGGWITDNYTWRWIFFINLPVGILALFLVSRLIEDPPWAKRVRGAVARIDYIGVSLLVLGVGALQVMLDKGQEDDWFGSHFILTLAILAVGGPGVTGHLGVVLQEPDHRGAPVQESELPRRQRHDVHAGGHAVLEPRDDASVPAIAHGLHGGVGRLGAFGRRPSAAVSDARGRGALLQGPGALSGCVWLADTLAWACIIPPGNSTLKSAFEAPACCVSFRCLAWVFCSFPSIWPRTSECRRRRATASPA